MTRHARRLASLALLLPGATMVYVGLALCALSMIVEPHGSEE